MFNIYKMAVGVVVSFCLNQPVGAAAKTAQDLASEAFMQKLYESKLDVTLLNDEKKAAISIVGYSSAWSYSFAVEQRLDGANQNVAFATRDGITGKTKATASASYMMLRNPSPNQGPPPELDKQIEEKDSSKNILDNYGILDFSLSHFRSDVGYYSISESKKIDSEKDGFEASLGHSLLITYVGLDHGQVRYSYGLTYQRGYERARSNKEKNICREFDDQPQFTDCFKAYLLPGKKVEKVVPYLRVTTAFSEDNIVKAIQLSAKYISTREPDAIVEETKKNIVFEAPVHIWNVWDKKLSAGVKFAYATNPGVNEDKFSYGIFLTAPLSTYQ